ncbi:hypothetical protein ES705_35211 [subsurface metagenome]
MLKSNGSNYRWYILTLGALTHTFAVAMPMMSLPVLFKEISVELDLNLVQIGTVWGMIPLAGIFVVLIGGLLGDRFGVKRTLSTLCFLAGLAGALRGLSGSFISLATTMFLFGILNASIPINVHKVASIWFPGRHLGLANGILSLGMGLGLTAGAMISATILSPLLGGWRNVLLLYGAISIGISILWLLTRSELGQVESPSGYAGTVLFRQALSRVVRIRGVWFLGLIMLGQVACTTGMIGYLPLYLRGIGWTAASADGALAASNSASMMVAIPMVLLSDKLGSRKTILLAAMLITASGVGLLSVVGGAMVWVSVIIASIARDGFMAVTITMIMETEGVGAAYAGTALGLAMTLSRVGGIISPPVGNSLAGINPGLPFIFWAALAAVALFGFHFLKDTGRKQR